MPTSLYTDLSAEALVVYGAARGQYPLAKVEVFATAKTVVRKEWPRKMLQANVF